jgi:uncharacterized phiE125 gp8 family phage protein
MGLTLVSGPSTEPVTLAEAKAHCRVAIADDDGLIAGYILAARIHLENETRRAFLTQTWDATFDYSWPMVWDNGRVDYRYQITLPKAPLQSVTSISYVDAAGATQTLAPDQYKVNASGMEGVIEPAYDVTWPYVRPEVNAVTVRFVCGYTQTPDPIRQAMLLLIGHWYENRESVIVGSITSELPMAVSALMFPYRVFY